MKCTQLSRRVATKRALSTSASTKKFVDYDWKDALRIEQNLLTDEEIAIAFVSFPHLVSSLIDGQAGQGKRQGFLSISTATESSLQLSR